MIAATNNQGKKPDESIVKPIAIRLKANPPQKHNPNFPFVMFFAEREDCSVAWGINSSLETKRI